LSRREFRKLYYKQRMQRCGNLNYNPIAINSLDSQQFDLKLQV
jgi:hypothetical protein